MKSLEHLPPLRTLAMAAAASLALAGTANSLRNLRIMRRPSAHPEAGNSHPGQHYPAPPTSDPRPDSHPDASTRPHLSVLLPMRNEALRMQPCLDALLPQLTDGTELLILDDNSDDDTATLVQGAIADYPQARLIQAQTEPPAGWLGKPWACHRLAQEARGEILVFLDADVVLSPTGLAVAAAMLTPEVAALCPYPTQLTKGFLGGLIQPLLQWSWLTTLPLDLAEKSMRPSTAAGNGQLLLIRQQDYHTIGGHMAVRDEILEDVALIRACKRAGMRAGMADGTTIARCTMYETAPELIEGYRKSLWAAFGNRGVAATTLLMLNGIYLAPAVVLLKSGDRQQRTWAWLAYGAAVTGRLAVARSMRQPLWSAPLHPLSIMGFTALTLWSYRGRRRGELRWRGRAVIPAAE